MKQICLFIFFQFALLLTAKSQDSIAFKKTNFSFETIIEGEMPVAIFPFTNQSKDTVFIKNIKTSCGCTQAYSRHTKIAPMSTDTVFAHYNSIGHLGNREVGIQLLFSNNQAIDLAIQANVKCYNNNLSIYFSQVSKSETATYLQAGNMPTIQLNLDTTNATFQYSFLVKNISTIPQNISWKEIKNTPKILAQKNNSTQLNFIEKEGGKTLQMGDLLIFYFSQNQLYDSNLQITINGEKLPFQITKK